MYLVFILSFRNLMTFFTDKQVFGAFRHFLHFLTICWIFSAVCAFFNKFYEFFRSYPQVSGASGHFSHYSTSFLNNFPRFRPVFETFGIIDKYSGIFKNFSQFIRSSWNFPAFTFFDKFLQHWHNSKVCFRYFPAFYRAFLILLCHSASDQIFLAQFLILLDT